MVLLLAFATPVETMIPANGVEVVVPLEVTPVILTEAITFPFMFDAAPPVMPLKKIP
jgi:hypothetical protein